MQFQFHPSLFLVSFILPPTLRLVSRVSGQRVTLRSFVKTPVSLVLNPCLMKSYDEVS